MQSFPNTFPPFSLISQILRKIRQEKVEQMIKVTPTWQAQPWYPLLLDMSIQCPMLLTPLPDILVDPQRNKHPLIQNRKLPYRKSLEMEGISSNAAKPISQSRRPGSVASYKLASNKWTSCCVGEKNDLFCAPLSKIVNYLSTLFDEGLQYQAVNAHWSSISAYHNFINVEPIGKHPKICALLTGIFNERPLQPRYTFIWDIDVVLTYIKNDTSVNSHLFEKKLACKLTVLLALSSALRASYIKHLNINFMAKIKSCYKFYFNKLHKSWRKGKVPPAVT